MREAFARVLMTTALALILLGVYTPVKQPEKVTPVLVNQDAEDATAKKVRELPLALRKDLGLPRPLEYTTPPLTGVDVWDLQLGLKQLGFDPGKLDGVYGQKTARAVRAFQEKYGLPLTGVLDERTLAAMALAYEKTLPEHNLPKPGGKVEIVVDLAELQLVVFAGGELYASFPIGAGSSSTPTPFGKYEVTEIKRWSGGFGSRWIGLSVPWGEFGIHGTDKPWTIGKRASHGCIRMYNDDVALLADWVDIGTPVEIVGAPSKRLLFLDDKGADVKLVQEKLVELNYLAPEDVDGFLGPATRQAIIQFQRDRQLRPDGNVGPETYEALGI